MNLPSGLVFFLDFQYGTTKNPFTSGNSMYGNRNASSQTPFATPAAAGGLYGAGRFTYTTNQFSASVASGSSATTNAVLAAATWATVAFDSDLSASAASSKLFTVNIPTASLANPDFNGVRGFILSGLANQSSTLLPQFTSYGGGSVITFVVSASALPTGTALVEYNKAATDQYRGDFEDTSAPSFSNPNAQTVAANATTIQIPEINISM
jgi:hypothetical protein